MWPFDYFKKKREARRLGPTLKDLSKIDHSKAIPALPPKEVKNHMPKEQYPNIIWPIETSRYPPMETPFFDTFFRQLGENQIESDDKPSSGGGTFDGGGASGDWSDCSSDSSGSDSGSSCGSD